jgi:iron complex transport system substrate-binding protein
MRAPSPPGRFFHIFLAACIAISAWAQGRPVVAGPTAWGTPAAPGMTAANLDVTHSTGFSIEQRGTYKLVTVKAPWPGARTGFTYVLYRRGAPRPTGVKADLFIETPLRRVVTFSTTYIPQIVAIGEADSIIGVDSAAFVSTPEIRARIKAGKTFETTRNWAPNLELMMSLSPDAVFTYGMGNEWDGHPRLVEAGLPVIIDGEWNETDPLARAEWIKFIAAFYDREAEASLFFEAVASEYSRLKALVAARGAGDGAKPAVLVNGPFQGSWTVAGGESYMARYIADAGGDYLWADDGSRGGLSLSIESVFERGRRAAVWLNPALGVKNLAEVAALDPRFAALPAVAAGNVWNNSRRLSGEGGNDYFESGVLNPDKVLADLIKIFHPGLLADRPFAYYERIPR